MIKVFIASVLVETHKNFDLKNIDDIRKIFYSYWFSLNNVDIPDFCEEPYQYIMRQSSFNFQSY